LLIGGKVYFAVNQQEFIIFVGKQGKKR